MALELRNDALREGAHLAEEAKTRALQAVRARKVDSRLDALKEAVDAIHAAAKWIDRAYQDARASYDQELANEQAEPKSSGAMKNADWPIKREPSGVGGGTWVYIFADGRRINESDITRKVADAFDKRLEDYQP